MGDVVLQLGDQGLDAIELALRPQEIDEPHLGRLAVQVAVEVEQVRLEQRMIGVLVERRAAAEVDGARVHGPVGTLVPPGVHTVSRNAHTVRHLDVGGREAEQSPPLVADHDAAASLERTTQHATRQLDVAARQRPPDRRAADRLVDPVHPSDERHRLDFEAVRLADLTQQCDVALAIAAEVEVFADHHALGSQALHQNSLDERQRRFTRLRLVEGQHHGGIDAGRLEQLHPLVVIGQQLGGRLGTHDRGRVSIEGDDRRPGTSCFSHLTDLGNHGLMAVVEAVVGPDRDDRVLVRKRRRACIGDDQHGR